MNQMLATLVYTNVGAANNLPRLAIGAPIPDRDIFAPLPRCAAAPVRR
jgi:hypothetical protein